MDKLTIYKQKEKEMLNDITGLFRIDIDNIWLRRGTMHIEKDLKNPMDISIYEVECFSENIPVVKTILDKKGNIILLEEYFSKSSKTNQYISKILLSLIEKFPPLASTEIEILKDACIIVDDDSFVIDNKSFAKNITSYYTRSSIDEVAEKMRGVTFI